MIIHNGSVLCSSEYLRIKLILCQFYSIKMATRFISIEQVDKISDSNYNKGNVDQSLVNSLIESHINGRTIPAIIVQSYETRNEKPYYEVISGQHRYIARKEYLNRIPSMPQQIECIIRNDLSHDDACDLSVEENFDRVHPSKYDTMKICTSYYKKGRTLPEIAKKMNISKPTVSDYIYMYHFLHPLLHPHILNEKEKDPKNSLTFELCRNHLIKFETEFQLEVFRGIEHLKRKDHEALLKRYREEYPGKYKEVYIESLRKSSVNEFAKITPTATMTQSMTRRTIITPPTVIPPPPVPRRTIITPTAMIPPLVVRPTKSFLIELGHADAISISDSVGSVLIKQNDIPLLINELQNAIKK